MILSDSDLRDYAFAGFVITRPVAWQVDIFPSYPVVQTVSLSPCIGDHFPDLWTLGWSEVSRAQLVASAEAFGCPPTRAQALRQAANDAIHAMELAEWRIMQSLETVRRLRAFLPADADLKVLGFGLHRDDVPRLARVASRDQSPPPSLLEVLTSRRRFPPGGMPLGFELLVADGSALPRHSWLCNGLDAAVYSEHPERLAAAHLLISREQAVDLARWIEQEERGEPGLWLPWLLADYTQAV